MDFVRTRIAPSPTGYFHVGTARTALFNFIFAKQNNGAFVLRIEDTDSKRNKPEFETDILDSMNWLGLTPDETYSQSELVESHKKAIQTLINSDKAFISKEPSKEDDTKEVSVVRLRNRGETVTFTDLIRGEISFDTTELGDFIIARSVDEPLYHLAVVVDDAEMNITHVIRGEDHISNTPRQILIGRALGYSEPQYAHLPLILAHDKSKLSKRKHVFATIKQLKDDGYDAGAIVNFLLLLGWSSRDDREIFSKDEMLLEFDLTRVHKSGAIFNPEKLRWLNKNYLQKISDDDFAQRAFTEIKLLYPRWIDDYITKEKVHTWQEIRHMRDDLKYFFSPPNIDKTKLVWRDSTPNETKEHLEFIQSVLITAEKDVFDNPEKVKELIWDYANTKGRGEVLWPLRYALSGRDKSPDPFTLISVLGKTETIRRIDKVLI
jgi:glutamyl-tRNA synthetase